MRKKLSILTILALFLVSGGVAFQGYDGPEDKPHVMNQPDQKPDDPGSQGCD